MSFWTGYWLGRTSGNNDNKGRGDGGALLVALGVTLFAGYAFAWGAYNVTDSVQVFLSYYMDGIDIRSYDFYNCKSPSSIWGSHIISNYNDCFHYTKSFYYWGFFIKITFMVGWLVLILRSLAGSHLAFWTVSILSCLAIVAVWAMCGEKSCAAHTVAWLKDWPYWPENGGRRAELIMERIGFGLLAAGPLLLVLILLRRARLKHKKIQEMRFTAT